MLFHIEHSVHYTYDAPVFLEPMILRLRPRSDCTQRLIFFQLNVEPQPVGMSEGLDLDGNCFALCWFNDEHDQLTVRTVSDVETMRENPFDFIFYPAECSALPLKPVFGPKEGLKPYLERTSQSDVVDQFAREVFEQSDSTHLGFLCRLAQRVSGSFEKITRKSGEPWLPEQTLKLGKGACRDLTLLYMDCCRYFGIPARFVSGYAQNNDKKQKPELHAWAEVYLPGGGWRGFDPSIGLAVSDRHIALATSQSFPGAAPTHGTFRGDAGRQMSYEITISVK